MAAGRYMVKEVFGPTLQGEGPHAGAPCLFLRLSGCNAWDGRAATRATSACPYCDTDFRGGELLDWNAIDSRFGALHPDPGRLGCVLTGGEPLLQADADLLALLGQRFAWIDVETNGTRPMPVAPANCTVVCSPKTIAGEPVVVQPDAWKILIPDQEAFLPQAEASGRPIYLQPVCPDAGPTGTAYQDALDRCIALCQKHGYRLSLQWHKYLGLD